MAILTLQSTPFTIAPGPSRACVCMAVSPFSLWFLSVLPQLPYTSSNIYLVALFISCRIVWHCLGIVHCYPNTYCYQLI
ncbi:hypothetical protein BKA93DRAFT_334683 [Sparassis latifolia]